MMLLLDALITGLLLVVLGLGVRLHRRLEGLRQDSELERLIEALGTASAHAQSALENLRQTADARGERLASDLTRAQRLLDDLHFLTSRGEQLADRLEEQISKTRPATATSGPTPARPAAAGSPGPELKRADLERTLGTLR